MAKLTSRQKRARVNRLRAEAGALLAAAAELYQCSPGGAMNADEEREHDQLCESAQGLADEMRALQDDLLAEQGEEGEQAVELREEARKRLFEAVKIGRGKGGALSPEERNRRTRLKNEATALLDRAEVLEARSEGRMDKQRQIERGRRELNGERDPGPLRGLASGVESMRDRFLDDPLLGFGTPAGFFRAVMQASLSGEEPEGLAALRSVGPDGTLLYQMPSFAKAYAAGGDEHSTVNDPFGGASVLGGSFVGGLKTVQFLDPMAGRTQNLPMDNPTVKVLARVDKNHSTSVSGGLRVYRRMETQTVEASRMQMEVLEFKAEGMMGISYASEELLQDSAIGFAITLERGFREEFASKKASERLRGGATAGEYHGVLNSDCLISVAQESGQAADTIVLLNLVKMIARLWGMGIWIYNPECEVQLRAMTAPDGSLIWQDGATEAAPSRLLGLPAFKCDECSVLGDQGDIILGAWSEYLEGVYKPMEAASSMHVRFVNNERCFRFLERNCGAPWWRSALTPKHGATRSPFVTLDARAG